MAKILLVEDDNNLREIYEARLQAEGYEIVSARDGEEALTVAMKEKPDLIISDVMMPKISGFDMLDILRTTEETKDAKVIMMTALSQAEDKERAEKLGADRYLVKSQVTLEDVAKVAREVLEGKPAEEPTPPVATEEPDPDGDPVVVPSPSPENSTTTATSQTQTPTTPATPDPAQTPTAPVPTPDPTPAPPAQQAQSTPAPTPDPTVATAPPVPEPVVATQQPPQPTSTPDPATSVTPPAPAPIADPAQAPVNTAGLDVIASAQPTPTPAPAEPTNTTTNSAIPVGTPDDSAAQPAIQPQQQTDQLSESVESEEQAIAKQIHENLKHTEAQPETQVPAEQNTTAQEAPSQQRKTIEPINDINAPGPDLASLAAKEEIMAPPQTQTQQSAPDSTPVEAPTVIQPTQPDANQNSSLQQPPAPSNEDTSSIDPNSIAL